MSKPESEDEIVVDKSSGDSAKAVLFDPGIHQIADWEVPGGHAPCSVYRDGPESMGRVTTPLGDLHFTNLFGSTESMARQLGRRSGRLVSDGAVSSFSEFTAEVVGALAPRPLVKAGRWALHQWLIERLKRAVPARRLAIWRSFAEETGHDVETVVDAQLSWDVWSLMARAPMERIREAVGRARRHSPLLGGFSMILPSRVAGPLHLRWFDNAAVDRWERRTTTSFFHPDRGLSYVLVSSAGFVTGLPCGMNAAGLTVSVEPSPRGGIEWQGTVPSARIQRILAEAHTIEETASLLREQPALTAWRYVVCEGETGRAAVFETGDGVERLSEFDSPPFALEAGDAALPGGEFARVDRWHSGRRKLLDEMMDQWSVDGDDVIYEALRRLSTLADNHGGTGAGRPFAELSNTAAVVFEPAARRLWVAVGRAPVGRRWFVPMSLGGGDATTGGLDNRVRPIKPAGNWESEQSGRAVDHLRHSYQRMLAGETSERILITLEHAVALDAGCASFHVLLGLMALKARRARRAEGAFRKAVDLIGEPTRRAEIQVYLGWALDAQRRRKEARRLYARICSESNAEPTVRRWALQGRKKRFTPDEMKRFDIDFFLATVFESKL